MDNSDFFFLFLFKYSSLAIFDTIDILLFLTMTFINEWNIGQKHFSLDFKRYKENLVN